jgi:hypothetical protein
VGDPGAGGHAGTSRTHAPAIWHNSPASAKAKRPHRNLIHQRAFLNSPDDRPEPGPVRQQVRGRPAQRPASLRRWSI